VRLLILKSPFVFKLLMPLRSAIFTQHCVNSVTVRVPDAIREVMVGHTAEWPQGGEPLPQTGPAEFH
jgi:hypothetical protein